jgi:ATP-dependent DNA helicase DinG
MSVDFGELLDAATMEQERVFERVIEHMGLTARPQQTALVKFAREAVSEDSCKLVQAGTGTGKSYAVLSAALEAARINGMPSVVICPNNTLIDQYVGKDAPKVAAATGGKFEYLKGRNRYVCSVSRAMRQLTPTQRSEIFDRIAKSGWYEWAENPEMDNTWGCSSDCDPRDGDLCAVQFARQRAQQAEVVVTNAHLLVWDLKVLDMTDGQVRLLPEYGALFVDECHELEAIGRDCYSDQITPGSAVYDEVHGLREWVAEVTKEITERDELPFMSDDAIRKMAHNTQIRYNAVEAEIAQAFEIESAGRDVALLKEYRREAKTLKRFLELTNEEDERFISTITMEWSDKEKKFVPMLNRRCVDASGVFRRILGGQSSVLVSGTIPLSLSQRLGVGNATLDDVGHPFNYGKCTIVFSNYSGKDRDKAWEKSTQIAAAINSMDKPHGEGGGGTLILFTAWADLELVMPLVMKQLNPGIPVFAQSKTDANDTKEMIEEFRKHGNAVLCGVKSLFTGLDIPGPALRQVVIYKLPWGVPTLEVKAIEKIHGRQPYVDQMMTELVQAIGRLVRTVKDDGRVFIVDSRARSLRWSGNPMSRHVAKFTAHR